MNRGFLTVAALFCVTGVAAQEDTATLLEMRNLATAMESVYIDTGYFTTIENLDDTTNSNSNPDFQYINEEGGAVVVRPDKGVPERRFLTTWWGPYLGGAESIESMGAGGR
jgi:hypothetical protein